MRHYGSQTFASLNFRLKDVLGPVTRVKKKKKKKKTTGEGWKVGSKP